MRLTFRSSFARDLKAIKEKAVLNQVDLAPKKWTVYEARLSRSKSQGLKYPRVECRLWVL